MCFGLLRILIPLSVGSPLVKLNSIDYSRDIILLIIQEIVVNFRVFQTFHMGLDIPVFAYASCVPGGYLPTIPFPITIITITTEHLPLGFAGVGE